MTPTNPEQERVQGMTAGIPYSQGGSQYPAQPPTILGAGNVPQGNPDDGQNFSQYDQNFRPPESRPQPQPEKKREPVKHTGKEDTQIITVREEMPRGGFLYHEFLVRHSGFGHWRIENAGADEPFYTSMDDVKDAIRNQKYEGQVTFGKLDPTKGWEPEG